MLKSAPATVLKLGSTNDFVRLYRGELVIEITSKWEVFKFSLCYPKGRDCNRLAQMFV